MFTAIFDLLMHVGVYGLAIIGFMIVYVFVLVIAGNAKEAKEAGDGFTKTMPKYRDFK